MNIHMRDLGTSYSALSHLATEPFAAAAMLLPAVCIRGTSSGVGDNSCWIFVITT